MGPKLTLRFSTTDKYMQNVVVILIVNIWSVWVSWPEGASLPRSVDEPPGSWAPLPAGVEADAPGEGGACALNSYPDHPGVRAHLPAGVEGDVPGEGGACAPSSCPDHPEVLLLPGVDPGGDLLFPILQLQQNKYKLNKARL